LDLKANLVNKNSKTPLHQQVKQIILDGINNCDEKSHNPIPIVKDFCNILGISRPTVYRAISELKNEGYLYKQDKGTYVPGSKIEIDLKNMSNILCIKTEDINNHRIEVVKRKIIRANKKVAENLNLREQEEVLYVLMHHYTNDTIMACDNIYLKFPLCEFVTENLLNSFCIYEILANNDLTRIKKVHRSLDTCYATEMEILFMNQSKGALINLCQNVGFSRNDEPIIYEIVKYRNDRIRYLLNINLAN